MLGFLDGAINLLKNKNIQAADVDIPFKEPEGLEKPFAAHYQEHIRPHILHFENKRVDALKLTRERTKTSLPIFAVVVVLCIGAFVVFGLNESVFKTVMFVILATAGGLGYWVYKPEMDYKTDIKSTIFPNIFSYFGDDYSFREKVPFEMSKMKPSSILPRYNQESLEDLIRGTYKEVSLELFEAHLVVKGDKSSHTTFKGICVLLGMNKNFQGKTIVKTDGGAVGNFLGNMFKGAKGGLENVKLEDPTFEKQFEVYSDDQVEARYLLTTSFMERLMKLVHLYGGKDVQCSFYDDKLFLMIPNKKNMFEASSIFVPATFHDDIETILEEMPLIFQIIDTLKLDQRTGL